MERDRADADPRGHPDLLVGGQFPEGDPLTATLPQIRTPGKERLGMRRTSRSAPRNSASKYCRKPAWPSNGRSSDDVAMKPTTALQRYVSRTPSLIWISSGA